ncbi:S-methyl thiohydantoin desulfurase domain-containing protein [Salinicoccus roseus]
MMYKVIIFYIKSDFHESLSLENIRYGMRVYVLGIPCHDKWRTEKGIKV